MTGRPRRSTSKLSLILLGIFVVVLSGAGVTAFKTLTFVNSVSTASTGDNIKSIVTTAAAPVVDAVTGVDPTASAGPAAALPERINILLLGYGGGGHDGGDLTDSIMVLTYDQKTKQAAMISVPRDIWVRIPDSGSSGDFWKLNAAYVIGEDDSSYPNKQPEFKGNAGGGNLAANVVGSILGIKIDYWVAVDFHAFKSVVDALGGVDVNVDTAFTDDQYPRNDNPDIDASYMTVHFDAGMQHMTGDRALIYARSRHSLEDGTDFGRSKRQQKLLVAIKDKALTPAGLTKVFGLMDALSGDFKTNLNLGQMKALAGIAKGVDVNAIDHVSIDNTNYLYDGMTSDGQDVLVPNGKSWAALRGYIAGLLMDPSVKAEGAKIQLWNGSGLTGVAGNATTMLDDLGLRTLPPQNLNTLAVQQTEVHDLSAGRDASTVSYLANLFGAKVVTESPTAADEADIKVILGRSWQQQSSSIVDSFDPSVAPLFGAPTATVIDAPQPVPGRSTASAAASAAPSASARASAAPEPSVRTSASARVVTALSAPPAASGKPGTTTAASTHATGFTTPAPATSVRPLATATR
ncbi:MAG: LCP family protein [Chloroflexi bacterium]|nr:LCP family protein [Chloroflexota bacterium]